MMVSGGAMNASTMVMIPKLSEFFEVDDHIPVVTQFIYVLRTIACFRPGYSKRKFIENFSPPVFDNFPTRGRSIDRAVRPDSQSSPF